VSESLCGTWKLLSWRRTSTDAGSTHGTVSYPLGSDAIGELVYTSQGRMAVQMAAAERPPLDTTDPLGGDVDSRARAYGGYLAYFGSYLVEEAAVVHVIEGSSFPNWTGQKQKRPFTRDGEELVLRTPPAQLPDGTTVVNEMSWTRVLTPPNPTTATTQEN
jgi:hypothetical protein